MLTPEFELSQDNQFITITIKVRHAKISEIELYIDGPDFRFYMKPYYLRLCLPGDLVEDGRETASYDIDRATLVVRAPKANEGQWFDGLDMLTTLMAPRRRRQHDARPAIEEIQERSEQTEDDTEQVDDGSDADDDFFIEQEIRRELSPLTGVKYGFANRLSGFFTHCEDYTEIVDVPDPDHMPAAERRSLRLADEKKKFNPEHYLYDLFENEDIERLLAYQPPYRQLLTQHEFQVCQEVSGDAAVSVTESRIHPSVTFSDEEKDALRRLPNRKYLLDKREERTAYLCLVDLIFCYAYNHRITEGDNSVESPWTVGKLSPTLCWLDSFSSVSDVLTACCRRSLIYPLYCHFDLTQSVLTDLHTIFRLGCCQLVKCVLELRHMIARDETRRMLNDLYVTDVCVWAQAASRRKIKKIADRIHQFRLQRDDVDLDLEELETTVRQALAEGGSNDDSTEDNDNTEDTDSDDSSSDDETDDSDEEDPDRTTDDKSECDHNR
ncbi:protein SHQ1 homolog [Corticium candelabrum]|uniref:protein SHQ1 homolog n=1 Tax=Corticium candelabrum TaxID=121492 RepID=UPI002E270E58|nr:protein SHQ1 homolog [Corticium candelabrum]